MITFTVNNGDNGEHTFSIETKETVMDLKEKIRNKFNVSAKYIDISFQLDKPIRSLGKFNLEPGVLPRTLDRYSFDRFELEGRTIPTSFKEVEGYTQKIIKKKSQSTGSYRPPTSQVKSGDVVEGPSFDITSNDDFPSLC